MQGMRIPPLPVVIGEAGAKDWGDNSANNTDTTVYTEADKVWLNIVASYLRALSERTGRQPSWFWWAFNANVSRRAAAGDCAHASALTGSADFQPSRACSRSC